MVFIKIFYIILIYYNSLFFQGFITNNYLFNLNIHTSDTTSLPFWDDFSINNTNNKWSKFDNKSIKNYGNNNAPSINVIEFDGLDSFGTPYNHTNGYGESDVLISSAINIENYINNNTIYMSFFWNFNINGELPDYQDSLKLEFLNSNQSWEMVWFTVGGIENFKGNNFQYEIINVGDKFLHDNFKFKFSNIGNSEGPFDSWVIDYIYINNDRSIFDSTFIDRTLTNLNSKIFSEYVSIPIDHFENSIEILDSMEISIKNLDSNIQPINYFFKAFSNDTDESIDIISGEELSPILNGFETRSIKTGKVDITRFNTDKDSLNLNLIFYITSGDLSSENKNYLNNDTSYSSIKFSNFYSYDDGEAEYAAGLNQKNSELVVKFYTLQQDTLTHLAILFSSINNSYNEDINLVGYKNIDQEKLFDQRENIDSNNKIITFKLKNPLIIEDTFFIGFKQNSDTFLPVGLDKNNESNDKIFFKVDGRWNQNEVINGSFIIRPIFAKTDGLITKVDKSEKKIIVYPNPSGGSVYFDQKIDKLFLVDLKGKVVSKVYKNVDNINLNHLVEGTYYIIININSKTTINKLIIKK